jgi:glycosyltransferase involved in cell wall biosynthesis
MPGVSIITCTYNRADLIGETIQSVLGQTYTDFEYLIIDEGQDDTEAIVRGFVDNRVRYFKLANTDGCLSKLRNFGIRNSTGTYIALVDSDDIWLPDKLQQQMTGFEGHSRAAFSFTDVSLFDRSGITRASLYNKSGVHNGSVFDDFVRNRFVIYPSTLVFRRDCVDTAGYQDEQIKVGDFDFIMSLVMQFEALVYYRPLVHIRKHDANITRHLPLRGAEDFLTTYDKVLKKGCVTRQQLGQILGRLCYSLGTEFAKQGENAHAVLFYRKSIGYNSLFWRSYVRLLMAKLKINR